MPEEDKIQKGCVNALTAGTMLLLFLILCALVYKVVTWIV